MAYNLVIPVRKGSERVPNKNFREFFNGKSLLELKLEQISLSNLFDSITIDSDSNVARDLSKKYDVNFIQRPEYFAGSKLSNSEYWQYFGKYYSGTVVMMNVTNPFISTDSIKDFLTRYSDGDFLTGTTVSYLHNYIFSNNGTPVNFDINNISKTQDLPNFFTPNFAINIAPSDYLASKKRFFSENCLYYPLSKKESFDIDDEEDFLFASNLMNYF
jgi:CMP-N-acetylneuraminic acid synthetase